MGTLAESSQRSIRLGLSRCRLWARRYSKLKTRVKIAWEESTAIKEATLIVPLLALCVLGAFVAQSMAPASGLVAAYGFNEGSGTSATDASGNNNTGTILGGAAWTATGKYGTALNFDGISGYVSIADANSLHIGTTGTMEAWVRLNALGRWNGVIAKGDANLSPAHNYAIEINPANTIECTVGDGSAATVVTSTTPLTNAFYHLACTWDGTSVSVYINGVLDKSGTQRVTPTGNTAPLYIGQFGGDVDRLSGIIDEVRIYNRALSQAEIQIDMGTPVGNPSLTGVAVTPGSFGLAVGGATQQLTVTARYSGELTANMTSDARTTYNSSNAAVATVNATGLVTAVANGTATITASFGGLSVPAIVTISITNDPSLIGQWSTPFELGDVAVNLVLLRTGKVLLFGGNTTIGGGTAASLLDPSPGVLTQVPNNFTYLLCSGQSALADGRILVVGGHHSVNDIFGSADVHIFDPATEQWTLAPKMAYSRWYPTATTLPDGRVLVTSGATNCLAFDCIVHVPEIYNPTANTWTQLTAAQLRFWYYPFMFVLPDGRVLDTGSSEQPAITRALDIGAQTWATVDLVSVDGGSAAMYAPGKVLKSGTASDAGVPNIPAANTTYVLDMTRPSPAWRQTAPMASPRAYHNLTLLPDGNVVATGGEQTLDGSSIAQAVYQAEMWSPTTETWKTMALGQVPRLYHSTALLLPDARVLVAGGGADFPVADQTRGEFYSPPYLFKGPRPTITTAPTIIQYGAAFVIQSPDAASIASISLIRPGAVTHQFNEDQRFLNLSFQQSGGALTVRAPANANLAPPGYYMLFLVNTNGVPSIAIFVRLS